MRVYHRADLISVPLTREYDVALLIHDRPKGLVI